MRKERKRSIFKKVLWSMGTVMAAAILIIEISSLFLIHKDGKRAQELFENTLHPYTKALLSAIPIADIDRRRKRIPLQGDVPSPVNPPSGCPFHPRCPECMERCKTEVPHPVLITRDGREHMVCCHRVQANAGSGNGF